MKLAIVRIRGAPGTRGSIEQTLQMLGLKKLNSLTIVDDNPAMRGMINKCNNWIAWGDISDEFIAKSFDQTFSKSLGLKPPRKGFIAKKMHWPRGDLGYRGKAIEALIKRMI